MSKNEYKFEKHHNMHLGWNPKYKGIVAQGKTILEVTKELDLLTKIKIDYDNKLKQQNNGKT